MVWRTYHWVIVSKWTIFWPPSDRLMAGDKSFLQCECHNAKMDLSPWWSCYNYCWRQYAVVNLQWRSSCFGCEGNVSKGRTREKEAIVCIPVPECQFAMPSPTLSNLSIHRSSSSGVPTSFPARWWRYGDDARSRERGEGYQRDSGAIVSNLIPWRRRDSRLLKRGNERTEHTLGRNNSMTLTVLSLGNMGVKDPCLHKLR